MPAVSAKALFRATKAKPRMDPRQSALIGDLPDLRAPEGGGRRADDFYPTGQPDAVRALLSRDGDRIRSLGMVWEPAVGDGDLAQEIEAEGVPVRGGDVVQRAWPMTCLGSFYDSHEAAAPAIVTNPPYCEINARDGRGRWLRHTLDMPGWRYCALLLSWDWPAARANGLGALLDERPFSYCYLMRWKLDFTGEGSPPQRNAWFIWDRDDPRGPGSGRHPDFRWLDKADARQAQLQIPPPTPTSRKEST